MRSRCKAKLLSKNTSCFKALKLTSWLMKDLSHTSCCISIWGPMSKCFQLVCKIALLGLESAALFPVPIVQPAKASLSSLHYRTVSISKAQLSGNSFLYA